MKTIFLLAFLALALCAQAAPELPSTLSVNGVDYTGVRYTSHDAAYVNFTHTDGTAKVELSRLPEDLQRNLGYSPEAAEAFLAVDRQKKTQVAIAMQAKQKANQEAAREAEALQRQQAAEAEREKQVQALKASAEEIQIQVLHIGEIGIIAELLTLQPVPGTSYSSGLVVRSQMDYLPSGKRIVLQGFSKQSSVAEGDKIKVRAYRDGVARYTDIRGADRSLQAWQAAE